MLTLELLCETADLIVAYAYLSFLLLATKINLADSDALLFKILCIIWFWLHWVFVAACRHSLAVMSGLLAAVASLIAEHRF